MLAAGVVFREDADALEERLFGGGTVRPSEPPPDRLGALEPALAAADAAGALVADGVPVTFVAPAVSLRGAVAVPGDKSVSHRAVLIGAICDGETVIRGFGRSEDTESTVRAARALGVRVDDEGSGALRVHGLGLRGLVAPEEPIDCGNAGTLVRLVAGILAGQTWQQFELRGDESLSSRPMGRVATPLAEMGAGIETRDGRLPLWIDARPLRGIDHELPVASAQVKSCVLLAGLYAQGETTVIEPVATRDHTERMLRAAGARIRSRPGRVTVQPAERLELGEVVVPGDISSAAPLILAATLLPGSELIVSGVGVNPTRTGFLDVLERMGGRIAVFNRRAVAGEPVADLEVTHAELVATEVEPAEVPRLVDELPLFALAASMAHGDSRVRGAEELRAKETDRIEAVVEGLRAVGAHVTGGRDGFRVRGVPTRPRGGRMSAAGDHRIAMLAAVCGLASRDGVEIEGAETVAISFPGFFDLIDSLAQR
jgi:3-phosphoshikimate 1-carboxyvinyltransferase